jgi:hypothetical protein
VPLKEEIVRFKYFLPLFAFTAVLFLIGIRPAPAAGIPKVTFEAFDYGFKGPDTLQAGLMTVELVNKGKELHHIQFLRLSKGKTMKDVVEAAKANPEAAFGHLEGVEFDGGPNGTMPGESTSAVVDLAPGDYIVACVVPNPKGAPHITLGMAKALTVKGPAASGLSEPTPSVTITAHDFNFSPDKPIQAGMQTIRFDNEGTQVHEILVIQLPPGKTPQDFAAAFAPGATGPPPGKGFGGLTGLHEGGHQFFIGDFKPGHYGLICFFGDAAKKAPHFALGMTYEFDVH